jgi:rhodanese-related sulfurtransferase
VTLQTIDPASAKRLIDDGAILVDVREPDEFARERVPGARNRPLSSLTAFQSGGAQAVIFHCKSGMRTAGNAQRLAAAADCQAYILDGGIDAWKKAGLPVAIDARQPIEIMRQVQITAGGLVLLGVILGTWVAPGFYGLSAFVGAGLMFAGIRGWCGMAKLLAFMPWNRRAAAKPAIA